MRLRSSSYLRRFATGIMLMAMAAFLQQTAMIIASQAAASTGLMPHPAMALPGHFHVHDNLAGNVHVHAGADAAGHVHTAPGSDHHGADDSITAWLWSFGGISVVVPLSAICPIPVATGRAGQAAPDRLVGVEPARLSRPPSTPSIA